MQSTPHSESNIFAHNTLKNKIKGLFTRLETILNPINQLVFGKKLAIVQIWQREVTQNAHTLEGKLIASPTTHNFTELTDKVLKSRRKVLNQILNSCEIISFDD